jgi:hypothetical protein
LYLAGGVLIQLKEDDGMWINGFNKICTGGFLVLVLLLGAPGIGISAQEASPENGEPVVGLVFVNALTALDNVDVYINGDSSEHRVVEKLAYGKTSGELQGTATGTVVIIRQNVSWGVDRDIFNTMIPTEPGQTYVVVISDFFVIPVLLDLRKPLIGDARSIGVHAAAEAPALDLYASESSRRIPIGNLTPLVEDLQYGASTAGGPTRTGSFDLRVTEAGTDNVVLEQEQVEIEPNTSYVFVVMGKPESREQPLTILSVSLPSVS